MIIPKKVKRLIKSIPGVLPLLNYERPGYGAIYMLHRCCDHNPKALFPNENLKVSPESLRSFIKSKQKSYDFLSLSELCEVLSSGKKPNKPFIVFTLDDGYVDNYSNALPIFDELHVPFTVYVTSSFPNYTAYLWWYELEDYVINNDKLKLSTGDVFNCSSQDDKYEAFMAIRRIILNMSPDNLKSQVNSLFSDYECHESHDIKNYSMTWRQIEEIANSTYGTIGGHTKNHLALNQLSDKDSLNEIILGKEEIESHINKKVLHMAYPFGSEKEISQREFVFAKQAGFCTATVSFGGTIKNIDVYSKDPLRLFALNRKMFSDMKY